MNGSRCLKLILKKKNKKNQIWPWGASRSFLKMNFVSSDLYCTAAARVWKWGWSRIVFSLSCSMWSGQNMPFICHLGSACPCLGVLINMYLTKISSCYSWGNLSSPGEKFWNISVQHNLKFHNRDAFLDGPLLGELWMNLTCRNAEDLAFWVLFDIAPSLILFKISSFTLCVMPGVICK